MTGDIPSISTSTYATTTVGLADFGMTAGTGATTLNANRMVYGGGEVQWIDHDEDKYRGAIRRVTADFIGTTPIQELIPMAAQVVRRLVQVVIADTDENVPLTQSLIYKGEPQFTDATDQELFFEIEINALLKTHNAARTKIVNKKIKDRTEYLEPAKIRDLKMVVVNIATF